jgi:metal-dependent amidase/aminoacylase/carboxypeptidase family protein
MMMKKQIAAWKEEIVAWRHDIHRYPELAYELGEDWMPKKLCDIPLKRFGKPCEIAPTAVLLASSDGDFYVGQTFSPNGGEVLK